MKPQKIHTALVELLANYNQAMGYSATNGRYSIVASHERSPHAVRKLALLKLEGRKLVNVSSWLEPMQLAAYMCGAVEAIEALQRRAARGEIPTPLRIAAAGLEVGFAGVLANGVFTKETS